MASSGIYSFRKQMPMTGLDPPHRVSSPEREEKVRSLMRGKEQGAKGHEWLKYSFGVGGDPL